MKPPPFVSLIVWQSPQMLWALGALAVPILLHWARHRPARTVLFSSLRLLLPQPSAQARWSRLHERLLLAARCGVVACLVLLFADPIFSRGPTAVSGGLGLSVIYIVDHSLSAEQTLDSGISAWTAIQSRLARELGGLRTGVDRANILPAAGDPRGLLPQFTQQHRVLHEAALALRPRPQRANLPGALQWARQTLQDMPHPRIVILSDMQATDWQTMLNHPSGEIAIRLIPVTRQTPAFNVQWRGVTVIPDRPAVGQTAKLIATIESPVPWTVSLWLESDGLPGSSQTLRLEGRSAQSVSFDLRWDKPGWKRITLSHGADDFKADDRSFLAVEVGGRPQIALLSDADPQDAATGTYFLLRALAPRGDASDPFEVRLLRSPQLDSLNSSQTLIASDTGVWTDAVSRRLSEHLSRGGRLLMFLSDEAAIRNARSLAARLKSDWPAVPQSIETLDAPAHLGEGAWEHPVLQAFDERSQLALRQAAFHRRCLAGALDPSATTLLKFEDGRPALVTGVAGQGRIALAQFGLSPADSSLATDGGFVALLHGVAHHLLGAADAALHQPISRPIVYQPPSGQEGLTLESPDGRLLPLQRTLDASGRLRLLSGELDSPGHYRLRSADQTHRIFAVNLDEQESRLEPLASTQIQALESGWTRQATSEQTALTQPAGLPGLPLRPWLGVAAMLLLGLESLLLGVRRP